MTVAEIIEVISDLIMIGRQDDQKKIYNQALMDVIVKIKEAQKLKGGKQ